MLCWIAGGAGFFLFSFVPGGAVELPGRSRPAPGVVDLRWLGEISVWGDAGVRAIGANEMMLLRPAAAQRGSATGSSTTGGTERSAEWWLG